jgi:predicted transcriptional regulator
MEGRAMMNLHFLYRMDLPHRALSVYIYLADHVNDKNECWPAIPTISKELKLSQSTVHRALDDLRKAGLITTEQRYRNQGGKSSLLYKLYTE